MKEARVYSLFFAFYAGSWISNGHIIRATSALLESASLQMILIVSSLAGLAFYALLRSLGRYGGDSTGAAGLVVAWMSLQALTYFLPGYFLAWALVAMLFGELVKWRLYSRVLATWGPMGASRMLAGAVVAYELGTITASLMPVLHPLAQMSLELLAMGVLVAPALKHAASDNDESDKMHAAEEPIHGPWDSIVPWMIFTGLTAGFMKVSADTGFKYAVHLHGESQGLWVSRFYLLSAGLTLFLGGLRQSRWLAPRMGCPQASMLCLGLVQLAFALALVLGGIPGLVFACALQRSVDKIFYQPTVQLLTSGFVLVGQEKLRSWHVTGFLALGALLGLLAFAGHGLLGGGARVMQGLALLHGCGALVFFFTAGKLLSETVRGLNAEARRTGLLGGSRPMAMLALLSPRHFLVHALVWAEKRGGMCGLPPDILQGLTAEPGREVVSSFYAAFPQLEETHQLALIRLAAFLDRGNDRDFLMRVAREELVCGQRGRRLAAHHLVKVQGKEARALLRRARGKNSPLPVKKAS